MNTTNIFEIASRSKFRYPYKGFITTEDLWDLSPAQLDVVYKALNKELAETKEVSLMHNVTDKEKDIQVKLDIVLYIYNYKEQMVTNARMELERSAKKQRILDILARKQEDTLEHMSEDDLKKMLDDLG